MHTNNDPAEDPSAPTGEQKPAEPSKLDKLEADNAELRHQVEDPNNSSPQGRGNAPSGTVLSDRMSQ